MTDPGNDVQTRGRGEAVPNAFPASPCRFWTWLLLVLAVALVLRAACFRAAPESLVFLPDSVEYLDLARGLLDHGLFGVDVPEVNRTPGYPLFCSLGLAVGGWRGIIVLQVVLDVLTTAGVFFLGRSLAGPVVGSRVGLVAAGVYAVSPLSVVLSCQVLTETLFLAVLVPSLWLAVTWLRGAGVSPASTVPCAKRNEDIQAPRPRHSHAVAYGGSVLLAVASVVLMYIRPSAMVFVAAVTVAGLWLAVTCWRGDRRAGLRWLARLGIYLAVVVAATVPWCLRNERAAGYMGLAGQGPVTYARDWAGLVRARVEGVGLEQAREKIWRNILFRAKACCDTGACNNGPLAAPPFDRATMVRLQLYSPMQAEARVVLTHHAGLFAREHVSQSFLALPPPTEPLHLMGANLGEKGTRTVLSQQGPWAAIRYYFEGRTDAMIVYAALALATLALYVLTVRGLWRQWRQRGECSRMGSAVMVLLGFFALAHFFAGGIATVPRYFLPLLPLVAIAAAIGVTRRADQRS